MAAVRNSCRSCERRPIFFITVSRVSKMSAYADRPYVHRSHFGSRYHIWSMRLARPFYLMSPLVIVSKMTVYVDWYSEHRSHFGSRYHIWSMRLARPFCLMSHLVAISKMWTPSLLLSTSEPNDFDFSELRWKK